MMASIFFRLLVVLIFPVVGALMPLDAIAETNNSKIGFVLMHGKGGTPLKYISDLASPLEQQGFLVANLEMPWSGRRNYDVTAQAAESEVEAALASLRSKGAQKVFVAGLSQGGLFALYFGTRHAIDGVIAIAPGGSVSSPIYRDKLGESVELARKLVAEGKGDEKTRLLDFEGAKGTYPILTTPKAYLSWFDPDGAMNQLKAAQSMSPATPVLFIAPTNDYPGLLKVKQQMFAALPRNPRTRLYEPDSSHLGAPSASIKEIIDWTSAIANVR
jgi:alpha-beta hydrolase superfamily lysophospholipase